MTAPPKPQRRQEHYETGWCVEAYGCEEPDCIESQRRYKRRLKKLSRMGKTAPQFTDIRPSRARVHADMEAGYTCRQLARLYGVTYSLVVDLSAEKTQRDKILTKNALKIKAAELTEPPEGQVPSLAAQRRIQALIRDGHDQQEIANLCADLGVKVSRPWVSCVARGVYPTITGARHRALETVFEKLVLTPGDNGKARAWGRKMQWARPLAWDPDTIDLPAARPFSEDDPERCVECQSPMLTQGEYWSLTPDERIGWTAHGGHGYCRNCYRRGVYNGTIETGQRTA